ncbi:MAG: hypothetical protein V4727_07545 [Verrucomicrobiota bacterium]
MKRFGESDRLLFHSKTDFQAGEFAFPIAFEAGDVSCGGAEETEETEHARHEKQEETYEIGQTRTDLIHSFCGFRKEITRQETCESAGYDGKNPRFSQHAAIEVGVRS